jgi:hypothetical protein
MSQINLNITIDHPAAVSSTVSYARIDNTATPVYTTLTGVTNGTLTIQNLPNGQYRIRVTPGYSDGRTCSPTSQDTPACTGVTALSAILSGSDFVISYVADTSVPFVQVNISYPNGGSASSQYANDGNDITIPVPTDVFGTYSITLSPVCDPDTGWIGAPTAPVTVVVTESSP